MELLLALLVGSVVGAVAAAIVVLGRAEAERRRRQAAVDAELAAARTRAERATSEAQALRTRLAATDSLATRVVTLEGELTTARVELEAFRGSPERGRARRPGVPAAARVSPVAAEPRADEVPPMVALPPTRAMAAVAVAAAPAPEAPSVEAASEPVRLVDPVPVPPPVVEPASAARATGARRRRPAVEQPVVVAPDLPVDAAGPAAVVEADASAEVPAIAEAPGAAAAVEWNAPIIAAIAETPAAPEPALDPTDSEPPAPSTVPLPAGPTPDPSVEPADDGWHPDRPGRSDPHSWLGTTAPNGAVYREDDLERIHGVGPYLAARLRQAGIVTWRQVAEWDDDEMTAMSRRIGSFPDRIRREDWPASARALHEAAYGEVLPGAADD